MCEDCNGLHPYHAARAERLQQLCGQLGLDAILLITGWDGCYNLGSRNLVEWLCDKAGSSMTAAEVEDVLEEGLFIITPTEVEWVVTHMTEDAHMHEQAAAVAAGGGSTALDRLMGLAAAAPPGAAAAGLPAIDSDPMQISPNPSLAPNEHCCSVGCAAGCDCSSNGGATVGSLSPSAPAAAGSSGANAATVAAAADGAAAAGGASMAMPPPDGKLSLLLHLRGALQRVGVPLGVEVLEGLQQQVDAGRICKWPLLMALAELAGIQPEQLFQEVVDISPALPSLMGVADGTLVHHVMRVRRPLLHRAWSEAMATCWRRSGGPKLDMSEAAVAAALTEFVSGCGCRLKPGQYQPLALPPRVLFGPRTSCLDMLSSHAITLRTLSCQTGCAVLHATVEAADACSALRVARTVFFSQGSEHTHQQQQQQQQGLGPAAQAVQAAATPCGAGQCLTRQSSGVDLEVDLLDLMAWYSCLVDAAWAAMDHFATQPGATWLSAQATAAAAFAAAAATHQLPTPCLSHTSSSNSSSSPEASDESAATSAGSAAEQSLPPPQLTVQLLGWTGGPRPMPRQQQQWLEQHNMRLKTLRLLCSGIRSRSSAHAGLELGSVLYSDTFLDAPAMAGQRPQLLNLTGTHSSVNTFNFWGSKAADNTQLVAAFRQHLQQQLQQQLQAAAQAQLAQAIQAQVQQAQARRRSQDSNSAAAPAPSVNPAATAATAAAAPNAVATAVGPKAAAAAMRSSSPPSPLMMQAVPKVNAHHQQQQGSVRKGGQRRSATSQEPQPVQMQQGLLQQLSTQGGQQQQQQQQAARKQQALLQHQLLMQIQQQQQQGKHTFGQADGGLAGTDSCCHAMKRSCCAQYGGGSTSAAAAAAAAASPSQLLRWATPSPPPAARTPPPLLPMLAGSSGGVSPIQALPAAAAAACGAAGGGSSSPVGMECLLRLGQLLLPQGEMPGEIGLVFTGASMCAVLDGPLYPHQGGLAFVSQPSKVHLLLMDEVEGVWLQDLASCLPGYAAVGPCLVLRGRQPACGLMPAAHMTDNRHVAIPLRSMTKACCEHWVSAVLPAWQAATGRVVEARGASAAWPLPTELQPTYRYWMQGPRKRFMLLQRDEAVEALLAAMDRPKQAGAGLE